MKIRILSFILLLALLFTSIPATVFSAETNDSAETGDSESIGVETITEGKTAVYYMTNGGILREGISVSTQVDSGSTLTLPNETDISREGYIFGGWYLNRELSGERLESCVVSGTENEETVFYAKWIPRGFYITIPANVPTESAAKIEILSEGYGFYSDDGIDISVSSKNDWKLNTDSNSTVSYSVSATAEGKPVANGDNIASLGEKENAEIFFKKSGAAETASDSDILTFGITFRSAVVNVTFETNGGSEVAARTVNAGTKIGDLPSTEKDGFVFVGWCFDANCEKLAESTEEINCDCTLYAAYITMEEATTESSVAIYCHASNVTPDYAVKIGTKSTLTLEAIKNAITVINANNPEEKNFYEIKENGDIYVVTAKDGWTKGSNYRFVIDTELLYFADFKDDSEKEPNELDMTVAKEEVNNYSVRDGIIYVPFTSVSDLKVNGKNFDKPSLSDMIATDTDKGSVTTAGSFKSSVTLKAGDIVGVYTGKIPTYEKDELISTESTCKYIEIVSASGNTYKYHGADTKDVVFTPDVFPIPISADTDGRDDKSLRALEKYFIYTDNDLNELGLNIDTTVDVGDFIAFYYGSNIKKATIKSYAKITKVKKEVANNDVYYVVDYVYVTLEQMKSATDTFVKREYTDKECEDIVNERKDKIEEELLSKSIESGLVEESAKKLAVALMATNGFKEKLEDNSIDSENLEIVYGDGFSSSGFQALGTNPDESTVDVSIKKIQPYLTKNLEYFKGKTGFRLTLAIDVEITVHGKEADIKFTVSGEFQQELRITIGADSSSVWSEWNGIPYISDLRISITTDLYEYTGMEIKVTVTVEGEDELEFGPVSIGLGGNAKKIYDKAKDIYEKIESVADSAGKIIGTEDDELIANQLAVIYARMLDEAEEAEWVDILSVNIYGARCNIYDIAEFVYSIDFIVSARMNLTLGANFTFATGKRYIYNIDVFEKEFTNETVDLEPEVFDFTFYAVGTAGIRAGIQLYGAVGLFSVDADSIGLKVRVGAFIEAHGYYFYKYNRTKINGVTTSSGTSSGAVYFEVGMFLKIDVVTQAGSGVVEVDFKCLDEQWTLLTKGEVECVQSFVEPAFDELIMKHAYKSAYLPKYTFTAEYLDLLKGADVTENEDGTKNITFFKKGININDLDISFTNNKFSYDKLLGCVVANPTSGDRTLDGEMVITYKGELAFSREPIQIRIPLHWDNLADGYLIAFESKGGSYIKPEIYRYGAKIKVPENPTRQGYRFTGWYIDVECTQPYTIPETMPSETLVLYAGWEYGTVEYKVEHYIQGLNGVYELFETELLVGNTNANVTPVAKSYDGFESAKQQTVQLAFDSSTVVKYYYARKTYSMIFKRSADDTNPIIRTMKYGAAFSAPSFGLRGYVFNGWNIELPTVIPASDMTFVAKYSPATDTEYKVCTYLQNEVGVGYTLESTKILTGTTGTTVSASAADIDGYVAVESKVSAVIAADGSTKLCLYYDRKAFKVTYDTSNGSNGSGTACPAEEYKFGAKVTTPSSSLKDYALVGWYTDKERTKLFDGIMPKSDITLYAKWEKGVGYSIEHYLMNVDGTYSQKATQSEYLYLQVGQESDVSAEPKTFTGFTSPAAQTFSVNKDGSTVVKFYYTRNKYSVSVMVDGKESSYSFYYEQTISVTEPTKTGYTFTGFSPELPVRMPANNIGCTAEFEPNKYKVVFNLGYDSKEELFEYQYGSAITNYVPAQRKGYTFTGWKEGTVPSTMPMENLTFTAQWTPIVYTITYQMGDDATDKATNTNKVTTFTIEDSVTITAPTRPHYDFAGWKVNGKNQGKTYTIPKGTINDTTIVATWKAKEIKIYFKQMPCADTGRVPNITNSYTTSVTATYGSALPPIVFPESNEYTFYYYAYENDNTLSKYTTEYNALKDKGNPEKDCWTYTDGDVTLYGYWKAKSYNIVYHFSDGSTNTKPLYYEFKGDESYKIEGDRGSVKGLLFIGWATEKNAKAVEIRVGLELKGCDTLDTKHSGQIDLHPVYIYTSIAFLNILKNKDGKYLTNMNNDNYVQQNGYARAKGASDGFALNGLFVNDDWEWSTSCTLKLYDYSDSMPTGDNLEYGRHYIVQNGKYVSTGFNNPSVKDNQIHCSTSLKSAQHYKQLLTSNFTKCEVTIVSDWIVLANGKCQIKVYVNDNLCYTSPQREIGTGTIGEGQSEGFSFDVNTASINSIKVVYHAFSDKENAFIVTNCEVHLSFHN